MVEHITPNDKTTVRFGHSLFYTHNYIKKIMLDLTLYLSIERDLVKFNITYYLLAWCNGSTIVF